MIGISYRRLLPTACLMFAPYLTVRAKLTYQSQSADLVKILEAETRAIAATAVWHVDIENLRLGATAYFRFF